MEVYCISDAAKRPKIYFFKISLFHKIAFGLIKEGRVETACDYSEHYLLKEEKLRGILLEQFAHTRYVRFAKVRAWRCMLRGIGLCR